MVSSILSQNRNICLAFFVREFFKAIDLSTGMSRCNDASRRSSITRRSKTRDAANEEGPRPHETQSHSQTSRSKFPQAAALQHHHSSAPLSLIILPYISTTPATAWPPLGVYLGGLSINLTILYKMSLQAETSNEMRKYESTENSRLATTNIHPVAVQNQLII